MNIILECDGIERTPNPCVCMCEGCTYHCGAHDDSRIADKFLCRNLGGNGDTCPGCFDEADGVINIVRPHYDQD